MLPFFGRLTFGRLTQGAQNVGKINRTSIVNQPGPVRSAFAAWHFLASLRQRRIKRTLLGLLKNDNQAKNRTALNLYK